MGDYAIHSRNECQGQTLRARDAVVWIEEGTRPAALTRWAKERDLVLRCTLDAGLNDALVALSTSDWKSTSDAVEAQLARAREQTLRDESAEAKETLLKAKELLFDHPSLPNAAWLLDETKRALASVSSPISAGAAEDGAPQDALIVGPFRTSDTVWLNSVSSPASLYWNVRDAKEIGDLPLTTLTFPAQPLPLHVRVERRGVEIASAWIRSPKANGHSAPPLFAPPAFACTRYDFARTGGAFCPRWVRVRKEYVSLCTYDQCAAETRLRDQTISWWMWTLAGATVTTGIVVAFASSGAFDHAPREVTIRPNGFLDR